MAETIKVHIVKHPYQDTIPRDTFEALLAGIAMRRAESVSRLHREGLYPSASMSFVILDPTASAATPADEAVLAVMLIGPDAIGFLPNALGKAFAHWETGADATSLLRGRNHCIPDGGFQYGGSVNLEGTIVAGSGQSELQDRYESTLVAADVNYQVTSRREAWQEQSANDLWFSEEGAAPSRFQRFVDLAR